MPRSRDSLVSTLVVGLLAIVLIAGCGADPRPPSTGSVRPLGPGERWLPVARWDLPGGGHLLCAGGGYLGDHRLHGSPTDPRLAWMTVPNGDRVDIAFWYGWSARFSPELEVLDDTGTVVAREGTKIGGGCATAEPGIEHVDFEVP